MSNNLDKRIADTRLSTAHRHAPLSAVPKSARQPWLSSNAAYFVFAATMAGVVFFVVFYALSEHSEDSPVVAAGLGASAVMLIAIFAREVVVRRARTKYLLQREYHELNVTIDRGSGQRKTGSFSLEQNASAVRELKKISAQAVSKSSPQAHLDVVRAASTYLRRAEKYLPSVAVGSPSLAALRSGQEKAREIHRFHLLAWAANESQTLTKEAAVRVTTAEKIETANRALSVIDSALEQYPYEQVLSDSKKYIKDFIITTRIRDYIEMAERDAFKGKLESAVDHYKDALFTLNREEISEEERSRLSDEINAKIAELDCRPPDVICTESE